jgi:hypothetical protein
MPWTVQDKTTVGALEGATGNASKFNAADNKSIRVGTVIRPGQAILFGFTMTAPAMNGTYFPKYQMAWQDHYMFGGILNKSVRVVNGTPNPDEPVVAPTAIVSPTAEPTAQPTGQVTATPTAAPTTAPATGTPTPGGKSGGPPCLPSLLLPLLIVGLVAFGATVRGKAKK